jgi:peptidoglycan hydrolase CwlO-like protein
VPWLQELEQQLESLDLSVEEHTGRIEVMTDHLKSVKQEITYTESRVRRSTAQVVPPQLAVVQVAVQRPLNMLA